MDDALLFKDREEWRNWLSKNHNKEKQAWLLFYKKGSGKKGLTLEESVEEAICFGWIDGKIRRVDDEQFVLRFSPRRPDSMWSKINKDRAEKLMTTGRMTNAGLTKVNGAKVSGAWDRAYTSKVAEIIPPDLKKALIEKDTAWANFQNFAVSNRNRYILWVNEAKTKETRERRIAKTVENAEHT